MTRDEEWERHYDSTNKWWYRYNRRTGESEWETEAPDDEINESLHDTGGTSGGVELKSRRNAQSQQVARIKSKEKKKRLLSGSSHEIGDRRHGRGDDDDDDDDETTLMEDIDRVYAETEGDIVCYYRCMMVTACIFEGPLAVIEAVIRALIFFLIGVIYILLAILRERERDYWYIQAKKCMREVMLCLSIAITFLIPFTGCCVYRTYRSDESEWDIAPMPTVLGWVDTRRFFTFCLGGGKMAVRGRADFIDDDEFELHESDHEERRGQELMRGPLYERAFDIHMRSSRDSWMGGIPFAPRKVSRTLTNVLNGNEESLLDVESQMIGAVF